jgi:hypothetical protein
MRFQALLLALQSLFYQSPLYQAPLFAIDKHDAHAHQGQRCHQRRSDWVDARVAMAERKAAFLSEYPELA